MQNCLSRICLNRKLFIISYLGYPLLIATDNSSANEQLNQQEDTTVHIIDILDNLSITNNCFFIITSQLRDLKIKLKSPIYDINTIKETLKEYDIDLISIERNIYHVKDISLECLPFISLKRFIFVSKQILNFINSSEVDFDTNHNFKLFFNSIPKKLILSPTEPNAFQWNDTSSLPKNSIPLFNNLLLSGVLKKINNILEPTLTQCELLYRNKGHFKNFNIADSGISVFGLHLYTNNEKSNIGIDIALSHNFRFQATGINIGLTKNNNFIVLGVEIEKPLENITRQEKLLDLLKTGITDTFDPIKSTYLNNSKSLHTLTMSELVQNIKFSNSEYDVICSDSIKDEKLEFIGDPKNIKNIYTHLLPLLRIQIRKGQQVIKIEPTVPSNAFFRSNLLEALTTLFSVDFDKYIKKPTINNIHSLHKNSSQQIRRLNEQKLKISTNNTLKLTDSDNSSTYILSLLYFSQMMDYFGISDNSIFTFLESNDQKFSIYQSKTDINKYIIYLGTKDTGNQNSIPLKSLEFSITP